MEEFQLRYIVLRINVISAGWQGVIMIKARAYAFAFFVSLRGAVLLGNYGLRKCIIKVLVYKNLILYYKDMLIAIACTGC